MAESKAKIVDDVKKVKKLYKIVDGNLRGFNWFQFEVGKTYSESGKIVMCEKGFHCCEIPAHCYSYVDHLASPLRYLEVTISGKRIDGPPKTVASEMTIVREIPGEEWMKILMSFEAAGEYLFLAGINENSVELVEKGMHAISGLDMMSVYETIGFREARDVLRHMLSTSHHSTGLNIETYLGGVKKAYALRELDKLSEMLRKVDPPVKARIFNNALVDSGKWGNMVLLQWSTKNGATNFGAAYEECVKAGIFDQNVLIALKERVKT